MGIGDQKRTWMNWCGLLGIVALGFYIAALQLAPVVFPGYDWMSQAISDLSAADAPSRGLWVRLNGVYDVCAIVCCVLVCVNIRSNTNRTLRIGIRLFTVSMVLSRIGFALFPLVKTGYLFTTQDVQHLLVTVLMVLLSGVALLLIAVGAKQDLRHRRLGVFAWVAFALLAGGAIGTICLPQAYFGIAERFCVLAIAGYTAVLGVWLFRQTE